MLTHDDVTAPALNTPVTPATPAPPVDSRRLWFKEIITALLALAVLVALLWTYGALSKLPDPKRFAPTSTDAGAHERAARLTDAHNANVDKIATALFGIFAAFVGYYAGRVPAEKAASDSNALARQAQQTSAVAVENEKEMTKKLEQELSWSERATDLLERTVPLLTPDSGGNVATTAADIPKASLANEITRHMGRRNRIV